MNLIAGKADVYFSPAILSEIKKGEVFYYTTNYDDKNFMVAAILGPLVLVDSVAGLVRNENENTTFVFPECGVPLRFEKLKFN